MKSINLRCSMLAALFFVFATTVQTHAMMVRYILSLAGDTCVTAGINAIEVKQKLTIDDQVTWLKQGAKPSQINQLKRDVEKVTPYSSILMPVGAVLSVGSRISMIAKGKKGIALALLSMPINGLLIASGYNARLEQAPDATLLDKGADKGWNWYNKLTNKKNK